MTSVHPLLRWLAASGVELHDSLYLEQDPSTGLSVYTAEPLARDTTVIRVPKSLCITSVTARERIEALLAVFGIAESGLEASALPAPDWILLYIATCRLATEYLSTASELSDDLAAALPHLAYVDYIPKTIETPLHFSPAELTLLSATPLVGSTERRLQETIVDYERARSLLEAPLQQVSGHPFTAFLATRLGSVPQEQLDADALMAKTFHEGLELWRWAESAFTSRSFPARLVGISDAPSEEASSGAYPSARSAPILIPAYDTFNHARARPVTWTFSAASEVDSRDMVCMTINYAVEAAPAQVYNNYGGKSNEELLAGYGFTLDTITEDTLALKIGSDDPNAQAETHYWAIPSASTESENDDSISTGTSELFTRAQCACPSLLDEIETRVLQGEAAPTSDEDRLDLYGSVLETLEALLLSKRKAFRASQKQIEALQSTFPLQTTHCESPGWHRSSAAADPSQPSSLRPTVWHNVMQYRAGQLHLLNHAVEWTRTELARVADALDDLE